MDDARRGGVQKRLGESKPAPQQRRSRLGKFLTHLYTSGKCTADETCTGALASANDQTPMPDIAAMAKQASTKRRRVNDECDRPDTRHTSRNILNKLKAFKSMPDVEYIDVPMWCKQTGTNTLTRMALAAAPPARPGRATERRSWTWPWPRPWRLPSLAAVLP